MDRRIYTPRTIPSQMDIEPTEQNPNRRNTQSMQITQTERSRRHPRLFENSRTEREHQMEYNSEQSLCRFCNKLISRDLYDQHLNNCPNKIISQQEDLDLPGNQDSQGRQNPANSEFPEERLQVSRRSQNTLVRRGSEILSRNEPTNLRPDIQTHPIFRPQSLFSRLLNIISSPLRSNRSANNQPALPSIREEESTISTNSNISNMEVEPSNNNNDNNQNQSIQPDSGIRSIPRGALFVRTIEASPNGATIVTFRLIPLDDFSDGPEQNDEENEQGQPPILRLLNMLVGLQAIRSTLFEERGLEKEALESLPVVKFSKEGFKNVDDECKKCPICLEHYEDEQELRFLWCLHRFHKDCVDQWLDRHTNCPFCKKDYSEALRNLE